MSTLSDPMDWSMPGFSDLHCLPVCLNICPLSQWCYWTLFSFWLQSFPALESFPMSQPFPSSGQNIRASASALVLPMNIQGWFPLGLTASISLLSKELSRVFNTTIRKRQFFGAQPSLWSNSQIRTWWLGKPCFGYTDLCRQSNGSAF